MTFKSKRTITSIITGLILATAYCFYALSQNAPAAEDISAWATTILIFIGIAVAANITIMIFFHIAYSIGVTAKEHDNAERIIAAETAEDEMDKLVELKSSRAGYICAGIGIMAALVWLAFLDTSVVVALHLLLAGSFAGSMIEGIISIRLYERGV